MNKRKRKKWLKQHNKYVNPADCWELNTTIAKFVLPRLRMFRKVNIGYPGYDGMDTPEKWDEALDKMIVAFEYVTEGDSWWLGNAKYDYTNCINFFGEHCEEDLVESVREQYKEEDKRRQAVVQDGLQLFAKWFQHLWW